MIILDYDNLPLRGKVSVVQALLDSQSRGWGWTDWEISNQARNRFRNAKAKNAKAKHRKRFHR